MSTTRITEHNERRVTITFADLMSGQQVTMEIWAPAPKIEGGYSYVLCDGDKQLCERLNHSGNTLMYKDGTRLVDLVRREYKAMRAADKRELARTY